MSQRWSMVVVIAISSFGMVSFHSPQTGLDADIPGAQRVLTSSSREVIAEPILEAKKDSCKHKGHAPGFHSSRSKVKN